MAKGTVEHPTKCLHCRRYDFNPFVAKALDNDYMLANTRLIQTELTAPTLEAALAYVNGGNPDG